MIDWPIVQCDKLQKYLIHVHSAMQQIQRKMNIEGTSLAVGEMARDCAENGSGKTTDTTGGRPIISNGIIRSEEHQQPPAET